MYRDAGIKDVSLKLCENDRHEVLNEQDRQQVYEYIWSWMEERIQPADTYMERR